MVGENNKVVIVTGGSSGIGRCTASALKENGCIVYEFSRRSIPMEGVTHLSVDVTDEDAVNAAVQQVIQKETKIDAVINCAGFGISGAVEFTSMEQAKAQFDVNFFGTVTVNKAVLPFLRHQGKGHIVNISSVAAVAHIPFQTFYSASKAAISSYSYALANEVKSYGIHVEDVKIKRFDLPESNLNAVYGRMISERNQMAEKYTADGNYDASIIRNDVDKQVNIIVSDAEAAAAKLEAEGEQEYMRLLAEAYDTQDKKDFYEFSLALDALKASLNGDEKTVILDANSELAKILMGGK